MEISIVGSTTTKTVRGKEYLYYVHYENRKKKEVYCGLASSQEAEQKALKLELEQLKEQKKTLSEKVIEIVNKLRHIKT